MILGFASAVSVLLMHPQHEVSAFYQPLSIKIPWQLLVRPRWMDVGVGISSVGVN